jgi:SAM-dependent methyltransferase
MAIRFWGLAGEGIPNAGASGTGDDTAPGWETPGNHVAEAKQLQEDQLEDFNVEYVCENEWKLVEPGFDSRFSGRAFSFLDVGGGNGNFADRLLQRYPDARGTVLDSARGLLAANAGHPRKELILGSAEHLTRIFEKRTFDLVIFNWTLHHFVTSTYAGTRRLQRQILKQARKLLSANGVISVFENLYNGLVLDGLPGRLIFHATASRAFAPVARRLGANTAGCGVCFLSKRQWEEEGTRAGLRVASYVDGFPKALTWAKKAALNVGSVHHGHYFMTKEG